MKMVPLIVSFLCLVAFACPAETSSSGTSAAGSPPVPELALPQPLPGGVEYLHAVITGTGGGRPLHAEMALPKIKPAHPMPAVIWIHGGGWKGGSQLGNPAGFLASYGYVTASIEYRLTGEALWPAQIEDCKLAVRWLRANAATYDVDPERIGCWGHSAGGHLVSLLGTTDASAGFEGNGGYPGVSSRVSAVVDAAGPNDATRFPTWAPEALFGKDKAGDMDLLKHATALYWVKAGDPPFLIIHGDQDKSVPIEVSVTFKAALQKAGVPVQMVIVKGGDHGFSAPSPGAPPPQPDKKTIQVLILRFFDQYLRSPEEPPRK